MALTGAEAALVVTNNAAALLLAVGLAGRRGSLVVSRGELVEIGGGVRIPEIVARSGARLVEVGTTNRTRPGDFEAALAAGGAKAVLRVHPSNFAMSGFTEAAGLAEVAAIAHRYGALVIDDLGSGALLDTRAFGLAHEPTPAERLAAGADVVLFSGDKLVGGPQAGLIVGRARPRRPAAARPAGAGGPPRQGDPRRRGRDPRDLPRRAGGPGHPRVAHDRPGSGRPPGARGVDPGAPAVHGRPRRRSPGGAAVAGGRRFAARPDAALVRGRGAGHHARVARRRPCARARTGSWRGWRTARSCSTCGPCPGSTTGRSRAASGTSPGRGRDPGALDERRRRHGRPHRPRQDHAPARPHRHRRRPAPGGAPPGHDDRRGVRAPGAA